MILDFSDPQILILMVSITLIAGVLSGSYPALLLPSYKIISSLKGTIRHSGSANIFRKGLVVFQFAISILLIIGTFVVYRQMDFILNKNLGLDKENLVTIEMEADISSNFESFKTELLRIPEVKDVTSISGNPLSYGSSTGGASWEGKNPDDVVEINVMSVNTDFIETMGMELVQGRDFSVENRMDTAHFLINEVAAGIMGYENAIGKNLSVWGTEGQIIGVVKDFHMDSMYEPIQPLIVRYDPPNSSYMSYIRIQGDTQDALLAIEKVAKNLDPKSPFNYGFLDEQYEQSYRSELTLSTLTNLFALVALFISCLGLFGLSSYSAEQRSREIGIRKVHGAGVFQLVMMLSRDYTKLIIIAFIMSAPLAYYFMQNWLNKFEFSTNLDAGIFIFSGISAFVIAALTISFKSFQAASTNPVETLSEE
jgi:ABC-type antimicrobial peptide transport system permease subunit